VSSSAILISPFRFSDYNFDGKPLADDEKPNWGVLQQLMGAEKTTEDEGCNEYVAYDQNKIASSLFAVHLNTLYEKEVIAAFAVHPGGVQSRAYKRVIETISEEQKAGITIPFDKSIDQGAATVSVAALDPGLKPEIATFWEDCQAMEVPEYVISKEKGEMLWKLSEEIGVEKLQLSTS
jgi:hypothetical protein